MITPEVTFQHSGLRSVPAVLTPFNTSLSVCAPAGMER
jgi:hypothetical protein